MALERVEEFTCRGTPELDGFVITGGSDGFSIGTKTEIQNPILMALEGVGVSVDLEQEVVLSLQSS